MTSVQNPVMRNTLLLTATEDSFILENGIVAVLGDEDQFVICKIAESNGPFHLGGDVALCSRAILHVGPGSWGC